MHNVHSERTGHTNKVRVAFKGERRSSLSGDTWGEQTASFTFG